MKQNTNIYKNNIKKIYFLKNEIKNILLKSLFQDKNVNNTVKAFICKKLTFKKKKQSISFQKSVCLILNKHRSVYKYFNLKRHAIKKLNTLGKIPNLKASGW